MVDCAIVGDLLFVDALLNAVHGEVGSGVCTWTPRHPYARTQIRSGYLHIVLAHIQAGEYLGAHTCQHERSIETLTFDLDL